MCTPPQAPWRKDSPEMWGEKFPLENRCPADAILLGNSALCGSLPSASSTGLAQPCGQLNPLPQVAGWPRVPVSAAAASTGKETGPCAERSLSSTYLMGCQPQLFPPPGLEKKVECEECRFECWRLNPK